MTQQSLWDHRAHLERVTSRIGSAIVAFLQGRKRFHADELREAVEKEVGHVAPGSADRILRALRKDGVIQYRVIDRRRSLYEVG